MKGRTRERVRRRRSRALVERACEQPGYGLLHASLRDGGGFVGGCGLFPLPEASEIEIAYRLAARVLGTGLRDRDGAGGARAWLRRPRSCAHHRAHVARERAVAARAREDRHALAKATAEHYGRTMRVYAATREA